MARMQRETGRVGAGPGWPARSVRGLGRLQVATDFSLRADYALERALRLPLAEGAVLELVHVRQRPGAEVEHCMHRTAGAARRRLRARADVRVGEVVRAGEALGETAAHAREVGAELVVLGRSARGAGRVDSAVVRGVEAPVLVVVPHPARPYERPLVAVDLTRGSRRVLELTLRLCPAPMRVGVLYVYGPGALRPARGQQEVLARLLREREAERAARVALARFLAPYREAGRDFELYVRSGEEASEVLDEADFLGADLVAVGRALAGRLLESPGDVLVAREV